jgi:hypothetical protein
MEDVASTAQHMVHDVAGTLIMRATSWCAIWFKARLFKPNFRFEQVCLKAHM